MGRFRSSLALAGAAWVALGLIFCANLMLLISQMVTGGSHVRGGCVGLGFWQQRWEPTL